jgi:predicted ATPase
LINVTYEPGALNLVIGENNSGKTNLCQAIRFLGLSSKMPLQEAMSLAAGTYFNLKNVYFDKSTIDLQCTYEIPSPSSPLQFDYSLSVEVPTFRNVVAKTPVRLHAERLQVTNGPAPPVALLKNDAGTVWVLDEDRCAGTEAPSEDCFVQVSTPLDRTALSQTYGIKNARLNIFQLCLRTWRYYDFGAPRLQQTGYKLADTQLEADGSNLVSVLHNLKNTDGRRYRRLLEIARSIEPKLEDLNFIPPHQPIMMLMEDRLGEKFEMGSMSNGTLRFLALCYILLIGVPEPEDFTFSPLLTIIEEPENGIYVGHLKKLLELIDPSGAEGQYIFTSHSPYFIDLFDAHLENVVVMKRGETHSQLVKPDHMKLQKYLEEMPLGELHFRDMIA